MKNRKSVFTVVMVFAMTLSVISITGCSKKNDTENKSDNTGQYTADSHMNDSSMHINHDDMNMEKNMSEGNIQHKMIKIPTAQCDVCKENITKALNKVQGIKSFKVDIDQKVVHINFDKTKTDINSIENAITMSGYDANDKKADPEAYNKLDDCCKLPKDRKNNK